MLKTARFPEFQNEEIQRKAYNILKAYDIDHLVVIGGKELERQRDSVAGYLEEMRGVLGNIMPQAPEFSDVISAALATGVPQAAGLSEVSSGSVSTDSAGSPEAPQSADSPASTSATEDDRSLQEDLLSMGGGRKRR